jgi:hypothetical protein
MTDFCPEGYVPTHPALLIAPWQPETGTPLLLIAKNLGHADTRMVEKHYGHLAPSYIADAIRAGAPKFGFKPNPKIATLATKGVP